MPHSIRNALLGLILGGCAWTSVLAGPFTRYCESPQRTKEEWKTIAELARVGLIGGPVAAENCAQIEASLGNTKRFYLRKRELTTLKPLFYLSQTTEIIASLNQIDSIEGIERLKNLEVLDLSSNRIEDLTEIGNLEKLRVLRVSQNQLTDVSPLASLSGLEDLAVAYNAISDISPLRSLENLDYLNVSSNKLSSLSGIEKLPKLKTLIIGFNAICETAALSSAEEKGVNVIGKDTQTCAVDPRSKLQDPTPSDS